MNIKSREKPFGRIDVAQVMEDVSTRTVAACVERSIPIKGSLETQHWRAGARTFDDDCRGSSLNDQDDS